MERFESVIENVSEINIKGYSDPEMRERVIEVWAKSDEEEHVYKFRGACAGVNRLYELIKENEKLENELGKWKREAADCLRTRDEVRREKNKEINELNQQLHQAEIDKRRLTYKLQEKSNLPETPITDAMLVDDYNRLIKENEKLKKELSLEKAANEAQRKFIQSYAGKGTEVQFKYAIDEVKEVSYVIMEKEKYESIKDRSCMAHIHGKRYNTVQIVDMIHELEESNKKLKYKIAELEELQTPTIENFADEEPSSKPKADNVNHPSHYETGKFECIEVMQEVFGITAVCDFCKCNAFKYIYRMDRKNGDEDVRKAIWYLNKYLELSEKIDIYKEIGGLIPRPEFVKECFTDEKDGGTNDVGEKQVPKGE